MLNTAKVYSPEVQQRYLKDVKEVNVKFLKLLKISFYFEKGKSRDKIKSF
jgi:hypothetical protein